jgi:WD40 repeat protein
VVNAKTGQTLNLVGHNAAVWHVCFCPDGKRLASGSYDGTVKVWDANSGLNLRTLKGHTSGVTGIAFSPEGRRLAGGSEDGTVRLWDSTTDQDEISFDSNDVGGLVSQRSNPIQWAHRYDPERGVQSGQPAPGQRR